MTEEQALIIKHLRCNKGYSWRMISKSIDDYEDQIHGRDLCNEAARLLGEDPNEVPWN